MERTVCLLGFGLGLDLDLDVVVVPGRGKLWIYNNTVAGRSGGHMARRQ